MRILLLCLFLQVMAVSSLECYVCKDKPEDECWEDRETCELGQDMCLQSRYWRDDSGDYTNDIQNYPVMTKRCAMSKECDGEIEANQCDFWNNDDYHCTKCCAWDGCNRDFFESGTASRDMNNISITCLMLLFYTASVHHVQRND